MNMLLVGLWLVGWILLIHPIARYMIESEPRYEADLETRVLAYAIGTTAGLLWPLAFFPLVSYWVWSRLSTKVDASDREGSNK